MAVDPPVPPPPLSSSPSSSLSASSSLGCSEGRKGHGADVRLCRQNASRLRTCPCSSFCGFGHRTSSVEPWSSGDPMRCRVLVDLNGVQPPWLVCQRDPTCAPGSACIASTVAGVTRQAAIVAIAILTWVALATSPSWIPYGTRFFAAAGHDHPPTRRRHRH